MKRKITALFLAIIMCFSVMTVSASGGRDISGHEALAKDLKALGLFHGVSDTDFDLDRAPTRVEAVIMLVRLLGKSGEATSSSWAHPFTDVPAWANNYVGYAYQKGLSYGTSDTTFGTSDATAEMYLTFVLRALGYKDGASGDFLWNDPFTLAKSLGILPEATNVKNFWRADVALISYAALSANIKNENKTLAQKLIDDGVFTAEQFKNNYDIGKIAIIPVVSELSAEQVYEKCSPAVFYIEVYNTAGYATATGSGFFIDEFGTAVTNYHVIEDAATAKATMSDTGEIFDIVGVYDYSEENDWAIIKVGGADFRCKYLSIGEQSTVIGGSTVYTIGSPLGLQNTISQGLISNVNRVVEGTTYIQISAPISHGSSGGALINKYGEVIGITAAGFSNGENLNLAIPITAIEGYDKSTITTLYNLFYSYQPTYPTYPSVTPPSSDNTNRERKAYDLLRTVVLRKANDSFDGSPAIYVETDTDNGMRAFAMVVEEDGIYLIYSEYYGNTKYFCGIVINPGENPFLYYSFEHDLNSNYYFEASEFINPSTIYRDKNIYFSDPEGTASEETNAVICGSYVTNILDLTNIVFEESASEFGSFSVADFGFVNFR